MALRGGVQLLGQLSPEVGSKNIIAVVRNVGLKSYKERPVADFSMGSVSKNTKLTTDLVVIFAFFTVSVVI